MKITAMMILAGAGMLARAQSGLDAGSSTVRVYVVQGVGDANLNLSSAKTIASSIFAKAGVHIKWQTGQPTPRERELPVIIDIVSNTPETLQPGALACSKVFEGVHIRIFWDRVESNVSGAKTLATFLLAHVMAHEITHILEGISRHSQEGVMKTGWTHEEIVQMTVKPLSLAPEDIKLIHNGLAKRQRDARVLVTATGANTAFPRRKSSE
jgi:hypothetical protein